MFDAVPGGALKAVWRGGGRHGGLELNTIRLTVGALGGLTRRSPKRHDIAPGASELEGA